MNQELFQNEGLPFATLQCILLEHIGGISEFSLIKKLQQKRIGLNGHHDWRLSEPIPLFISHFEVMHSLFLLRQHWRTLERWEIIITPLEIRLEPYTKRTGSALAANDYLGEYYLDRTHLDHLDADSVADLIQRFMRQTTAACGYSQALRALEFNSTCEPGWRDIKLRYRQLQHARHPDRGGNAKASAGLSRAFKILRDYYLQPR